LYLFLFILITLRPPRSTLFPYTTLFRSAMGCSVGQTQIGLMFSMVLAPMIFFGCVYYPWSVLNSFPLLQKLVLLNPLVYASEGLRGTLVPQYPHIGTGIAIAALAVFDALLIAFGLRQFYRKAIT